MSADYFAQMRAAVDAAAPEELALHQVTNRRCDTCGNQLMLLRGRHSGKWQWSHVGLTACQFDGAECSVRFENEQDARAAKEIFKAIPEIPQE